MPFNTKFLHVSTFPKIILASRSTARKKLMQELKIPFECHASGYEEDMEAHKDPRKLAKFLALEKARFIARKFPNSIIIGADTFITVGSKKIGKPASVKEAAKIVRGMSGKKIKVISGLAVIKTDSAGKILKEKSAHVITILKIKKLSSAEIKSLAEHEEALQISGAFSIEGHGGKFVESIEGDYNNVIGLPVFKLKKMLKELE